jgi:hypothetical protein
MYNKKVLSQATKDSKQTKKVSNPGDIIKDPEGQWKFPFQPTRIPGNQLTMQGVPYPVIGYPNIGQPQLMYPGEDYYFANAEYVDEIPLAQTGGVGYGYNPYMTRGNVFKPSGKKNFSIGAGAMYSPFGMREGVTGRALFKGADPKSTYGLKSDVYYDNDGIGANLSGTYAYDWTSLPYAAVASLDTGYDPTLGGYIYGSTGPKFNLGLPKETRSGVKQQASITPTVGVGVHSKMDPRVGEAYTAGKYDNLASANRLKWNYGVGADYTAKLPNDALINFWGQVTADPTLGKLKTSNGSMADTKFSDSEKTEFLLSPSLGLSYTLPLKNNKSRELAQETTNKRLINKDLMKIRTQKATPAEKTEFVKSNNYQNGGLTTSQSTTYTEFPTPSLEDKANATSEYFYNYPIKGLKPKKLEPVAGKQRPRMESGNKALIPGVTTLSPDQYKLIDMPSDYIGFPIYESTDTGNIFTLDPEYNEKYISPYTQPRFLGKDRTFFLPNRFIEENKYKQKGGFIEIKLSPEEIDEYRKGGYIVEYLDDPSVPELTKAQEGIEKEQDLPGMYAYADKKKQKRFANLLDQAKAFGKTVEGRIVDKENIYPDFSIKNVGQYVKDVKEYQKQAADYEKARRLVKEGTMSTESFLDRYNKNNWAKFDQATRVSTPEEQAELEEAWYGPTDEEGRRRWMSDPRNVAKVAGAVAVGAPLAPAAAILAPAAGAALANPLVQAGLTGYGVYDAATNTLPEAYRDFSEGRYLEGLGNVGMAALDVAPIPIFGTNLLDEAGQVGKYLTTQTPLKNAYKYNPLAFKPNPKAYYRMIGKEGYADALESGVIRPPQTSRVFDQGSQKYIDIPIPAYEEAYYNAQFPLDRRWYPNSIKKIDPKKAATAEKSGYQGPYMAEVTGNSSLFENGENVASYAGPNSSQTVTYSKEFIPINTPGVKFYKEDWLRGYKEVEVPKQLPGSPNATPISSKLPFNMDQETRDLLNYPNFNVTTGESTVPFTPSEGLDFDFKTFSPGWNAMQEAQLKLQGAKGPDIPDVSRLPWRKIDDMDLNPQGVSPEKYQEYGLDPEGFAFGKLKGERASMDPNYLENIKFAKQQALDRGDSQMANIYDDLLKRKQKEALESFTEPYTAQKAFKEIKYNMADDSDIDNAIDWANPNKEAHQTITKTITDVRENKLKNWSSDEGKKRLQAMIDETPWLKDNGITPENYIDSIAGMDDTNLQYLNDLQELDNLVSQQIKLNDLSDQNLISESDWAIQTMDLEEKIQNTQKTILKRRSSINEAGPFNAYLERRKPLDVQATMQSQFKGFDANGKPIFDTSVPFIYNENTPDVSSRIAIGEKTLPSDLKQVIEHEIGHLLQKGAQTNLDKELESLSLKGDDLFTNIKSKDGVGKTGWSEFKESPEYFGASKRYFETGSTGREKLPFLLEVRQDMLERGVIKDMYQEITPEMMERHYTNYMKGKLKGDKTLPLRIFDIMENKKSNFNLLSKVVNKAPVILPVAGTAGVLSTMGNNTESEEPFSTFRPLYKQGGSIDMELTPEEIQWYKDNGYVVEDINEYQEGGDVISSYGWDYKKEEDKYFTRKTGTEDWITPQGEALQAIKQKIYNEIPYTVQDRKSEYLANLQNLVAQGYGIDDLVKMGMGTKAGLTSILGSTEYVEATPVKETKVAETPVAKNSYWNPARYGNKFAITGMQNPKFALDMSSVNNFKLSKTPENVVHAKELRITGKQLTPQEQAAFDINYNPNQSIQDKLIYRQDNQPYKEPKVYTASEVIPTTYHWNPIFNTYSDTMGELFNPDTSFEVSDSLTKSSLPLANEIEGYNILKQKIKNELASNKPELKIEKIFRNKEQGEELLERQHLDNIYYGQFMNRGNAVANRTGIGRHRDSNILISDIVEKNPNTVVIDIGSGLGNDNPELAGVSLTELPKNVFAKAKVIGTDIPESYERFKMHQKEKQYPFDSYRVPLNFNTPVKDIIDKKAKNSKTVVLRAANSIDLLMNPEEAQKHLEHILKQTFGKEVYYLFNKHVLYKDSKSNSFKIIGQINNAGFDHINNSWETNLDRKSYELFEKESLR